MSNGFQEIDRETIYVKVSSMVQEGDKIIVTFTPIISENAEISHIVDSEGITTNNGEYVFEFYYKNGQNPGIQPGDTVELTIATGQVYSNGQFNEAVQMSITTPYGNEILLTPDNGWRYTGGTSEELTLGDFQEAAQNGISFDNSDAEAATLEALQKNGIDGNLVEESDIQAIINGEETLEEVQAKTEDQNKNGQGANPSEGAEEGQDNSLDEDEGIVF